MVLQTVGALIKIVRDFAIRRNLLVGLRGGLQLDPGKKLRYVKCFLGISAEGRIALCYELIDYYADLALSLIGQAIDRLEVAWPVEEVERKHGANTRSSRTSN